MPEQRIKAKPFNKSSFVITATLVVLLILTIYGFLTFDYKDLQFWDAVLSTGRPLERCF